MKKNLVAVLVIFGSMAAFASENGSGSTNNTPATYQPVMQTVKGKITDNISKDGLAGVEVKIYGTDIKTYTDFEGNFEFTNLPAGAQALVVNYISYQQKVQDVLVSAETQNKVEISLTPKD